VNRLRLQTQGHPRGGDAGNLFTRDVGSVRALRGLVSRPDDQGPWQRPRASEVFTIGVLMANWMATR
jgi:hypothetical protein